MEKGELQVADRERESQLSNQFRDIATIVMAKTVNPETERPYTITMIERLMREVHFAVDPHRNSKQQVALPSSPSAHPFVNGSSSCRRRTPALFSRVLVIQTRCVLLMNVNLVYMSVHS